MAKLQYGDTINFDNIHNNVFTMVEAMDVVPVRYDSIAEVWVVCDQGSATHMLLVMDTSKGIQYMKIEIGKCMNLHLLADILVD